jgi:hypothetical protein
MASFPDLRPVFGSAHAEHRAARTFRRLALLPAEPRAVLSITAFRADSELATLRGTKALLRTPASLTLAVRRPAPGTGVATGAQA